MKTIDTLPHNNKVVFTTEETVYYTLSSKEKEMKVKAYRAVCQSSEEFYQIEELTYMISDLQIE